MSEVTAAKPDANPKINPPLEVPSSSPQVGIKDPGFEKLTAAEKLNDSHYRKLVYQTYPDEATCSCEPAYNKFNVPDSRSNFLICQSGCKNVCCWRMRQSGVTFARQDNANKDDQVAPFIPAYCAGNKRENARKVCDEDESRRNAAHNGDYCCRKNRLRGGGEGEEGRSASGMYPQLEKVNGTMVRWLGDAWNGRNVCGQRLDAGGCDDYQYVERFPLYGNLAEGMRTTCYNEENQHDEYPIAKYSREHPQDSNLGRNNLCRTTMNTNALTGNSYQPVATTCCCPGRETFARATTKWPGINEAPVKKPALVIDTLVKAFQETQEFVDSLGKVPGLAGLGLMDPAESPYFCRPKKKESDDEGIKPTSKLSDLVVLPNPQCTGPCNAQSLKSTDGGWIPLTGGIPGRGGIVREAVPVYPGSEMTSISGKWRKKDDKSKEADPSTTSPMNTEPTPCGQPRCGAKRRKKENPEEPAAVETDEIATKKAVTLANINDRQTSRSSSKIKPIHKIHSGRRPLDISKHEADRTGKRKSSVKMGRRMMSFVYSAGDTYTSESSSHKNCIEERRRVPGNMGWLWNLNETVGRLKPRPGWRPGAIGRHMSEVLRQARKNQSRLRRTKSKSSRSSSRSRSTPSRRKRSKGQSDPRSAKKKKGDKEEIEPPPTLHIHRKDGTYYVTMYPIKQDNMDVPKLEEPMQPLQFKIARNRDDVSIASSSTASDMEIEFSPPAAVNRYKKKPNVIHVNTQVTQQEINDTFKRGTGVVVKSKKKGRTGKKKKNSEN